MWFLPLLVLGAIALAAANRSSRDAVPPSRQLAAPTAGPVNLPGAPGAPGAISVLGEILRVGQVPPPKVILGAIVEAESIGRSDLASDIVQAFVVPIVHKHDKTRHVRSAPAAYERGSCAMPHSPRAQVEYQRGSSPPVAPPHPQAEYQRGTCAPVASPRAQADQRGTCAPPQQHGAAVQGSAPPPPPPPQPQVAARYATQDEILAMLNTDPTAFLKVIASGQPPMIEVPIAQTPPQAAAPSPAPIVVPPSAPVPPPVQPPQPIATPTASPTAEADQLAEQLAQLPGCAGAGVVLADPSTGTEVFEVGWLRGYAIPSLPPQVSDRMVRVVIVDALPALQPMGLPPEVVAQMQETVGLHAAADQTRAMAPGSPLRHVQDDAWREFVSRLERESSQLNSSRHVGQYRQRRERLAELGIDPRAIHGSAAAQRSAIDSDLSDAHRHAAEGGVISEHLHRTIAVPGYEGVATITLSGLLGVIQCAGLDGAIGWLERPNDRKRYPHTTQAFLRTNGVF